ncbi:toll/interleukin-1 receptor domain-containing protein [Streptomyces sp. UH6]|uniref:toll/interleukin-1 receptor domain-containing protein n=1 Tax=Streptomyces sp. UH6 TaxID=2748379 RepID=UPI0015D48E91|nr:toll/interleukin-1 receptor domain-containing protein [Streptomyces sp. UH6]NYV74119.1 toll/interleukin-1 receptor domain-containing protein [Streptomyces sp. UH6]
MLVRRRLWWLCSCLLAWALSSLFVGPLPALAGLILPALVFVRFEPLRERRLLRAYRREHGGAGLARPTVVWRNLADPERLLFLVVAAGLFGGGLWLRYPPAAHALYWLLPVVVLFVLLRWTGVLAARPPGTGPDTAGVPGPASRPEFAVALWGAVGAVLYGGAAWYVQYYTLPLGRRTKSFVDELHLLEDCYRFLGDRIADSPFGVAAAAPYWPFLAAGTGLVVGAAAAAAREAVTRSAAAGQVFEDLTEAQQQGPPRETSGKVFVSYSRRDAEFAQRLRTGLSAFLREVWVDWLHIDPSTRWRESIDEAIRSSDALIVLVSRDSLNSKYCWLECERALALGKRVLPVVIDPSLEQGVSGALRDNGWGQLVEYQFLRMTRPEQFADGVEGIRAFVRSRHRWNAFHTRIGLRAHEWHSSGRNGALLLRGHELVVSEAWRQQPSDEDDDRAAFTGEQMEFLGASRAAARRRGVRFRVAAVSMSVALAALAALVVSSEAATLAQRREADSRRLAAAASERTGGDVRQAALLSAAAYSQADTAEARESLMRQLGRFDKVRRVIPAGRAPVSEVTFSLDESLLVIWREDATAEVWDTTTLRSRGIVPGSPMARAESGGMSADGRTLGVLRDGIAVLVDTRTMREVGRADLRPFGVNGILSWADLSRDGKTLFVKPVQQFGVRARILLWDVASGSVTAEVPGMFMAAGAYGRATDIPVEAKGDGPPGMGDLTDPEKAPLELPAGQLLGVSESGAPVMIHDGTIRVLTASGRAGWTVGDGLGFEALTPDGRYLAARDTSEPGRFEVWDLRSRKRLGGVEAPPTGGYGPQVFLSGDGRWLAVADTSFSIYQETAQFTLYDTRSGLRKADLPGHEIALGPRGRLAAAAGSNGTVTLWDHGPVGRLLTHYESVGTEVDEAAVAMDGDILAVMEAGGPVRLVRRSDGRPLRTVRPEAEAHRVALSPDGTRLAVAEARGVGWERRAQVEVFDTRTGRRLAELETQGIASPQIQPTVLKFAPDGRTLYLAEYHGRSVYSWHTDSWKSGHRFGPDYEVGIVEAVAVSPDGSLIAVGGGLRTVQVWDTRTGKRVGKPVARSVTSAFTPDGLLVLGGVGEGNPALVLWDPLTRRVVRAAPDAGERTVGVAVSADGLSVASVTGDLRLLLWDLTLERSIAVPEVSVVAGAVAFSGAGDRLFAVGEDGLHSVLTGPRRWATELCSITGSPMTPKEWQAAAPGERYRRIC